MNGDRQSMAERAVGSQSPVSIPTSLTSNCVILLIYPCLPLAQNCPVVSHSIYSKGRRFSCEPQAFGCATLLSSLTCLRTLSPHDFHTGHVVLCSSRLAHRPLPQDLCTGSFFFLNYFPPRHLYGLAPSLYPGLFGNVTL